jgi:hypothetical protein
MTAGPGDETAGAGGRGHLRASHTDREQAIGTLKTAFVQGRLTKDELDVRLDQTFASRTYAELAAVTVDLPARPTAVQPPKPARVQGEQRVLRPGPAIIGATVLYAGVWPLALLLPWPKGIDGDSAGAASLVITATLVYLIVLITAVGHVLASRHEKRSRRHLPPRRAQGGRALDQGDRGVRPSDDLILCQARDDVPARHVPGHGVIQRTWRSRSLRRNQRRPARPQVTARAGL